MTPPAATLIVVEVVGPEVTDKLTRQIQALNGVQKATPAYSDGFGRIVLRGDAQ